MGEVIFDGDEDVENWDSVGKPDSAEFNDFDLEFIEMDEVEEGDYWIGEFTGIRELGGIRNAIFDNEEEEISYAFTPHTVLENQLEEVDEGEVVAIVYEGRYEESDQPNKPHLWDVRRPPE